MDEPRIHRSARPWIRKKDSVRIERCQRIKEKFERIAVCEMSPTGP
jgi:hypothetical protein